MAPTAISAIIAIGSTAYSTHQASKAEEEAGREAKRLANLNAADKMVATEEETRRLRNQQTEEESLALARAAASGVDVSGSTSNLFLKTLTTENKAQLDWLRKSGLSASARIKEGGESAYRTGMTQAASTQARGLATVAKTGGEAFNKWYSNKQAKAI